MTDLPASRPDLRVRTISLTVEASPNGRYRISTPHARGWAAEVGTQIELARALASAFREVSVASYARAKGVPYDLDVLTSHVAGDALASGLPARARTGPRARRKTYHPGDWTKFEDGTWRSPSGRVYKATSKQVQGVVRARLERGMTI
jgi:hypothetical protein